MLLRFQPSSTSVFQCPIISLVDDEVLEINETFSVVLSTSEEFVNLGNSSQVTILNDDGMHNHLYITV